MKWKCTYQPEEESAAAADLAALLQRHPGAKVKRSDKHPPYRHIYVTIPESDCLKCDNAFHKPLAALREILDKPAPLGYNDIKGTGVPPQGPQREAYEG